jgi:hypothetical protein
VAPAGFGEEIARLQFLGEARLQPMQLFNGAVVGGLSGITYDLERDQYYAISDDQGVLGPPRLLTLRIDLEGGTLGPDGVSLTGVTELLTRNGGPGRRGDRPYRQRVPCGLLRGQRRSGGRSLCA